MSDLKGALPAIVGAANAGENFQIDRSLRFNQPDSPRLSRTPSSNGNKKTFTISAWVKKSRTAVTTFQNIVSAGKGSPNNQCNFHFDNAGRISFYNYPSGGVVTSSALYRDFSGWMHCVASIDTTQSTASDRVKIYVNGTQITEFTSNSYPTLNQELFFNSTTDQISVGANGAFDSHFFSGYIAEVHFIDGQALAPTDFGEFDSNNNWNPIDCQENLTYGTNGFYLKFADNSSNAALGTDSSGNGNNFTVYNLTANAGALQSQTWSDNITTTGNSGNWWPTYPRTYIFDSNITNYGHPNGNGGAVTVTFNLSPAVTCNTAVTFLGGLTSNTVGATISINDGTPVNCTAGSSSTTETVVPFSGSVSKIVLTKTASGSSGLLVYGFKIDGSRLIDSGVAWTGSEDTDSLIDTPTNYTAGSGNNGGNYATLNSNGSNDSYITYSNGNLDFTQASSTGNAYQMAPQATIGVSSGKWYWEFTNTSGSNNNAMVAASFSEAGTIETSAGYVNYYANNGAFEGAVFTIPSTASSYGENDIIGVALDADNGTVEFFKNGVSQGTATNGPTNVTLFPSSRVWTSNASGAVSYNFGQRSFSYPPGSSGGPSSDYKSLCTTNLPEPTITNGSTAFDTVLYTGNGSTQSISGYDFSPDLVWVKNRTESYDHELYDTVRGVTKRLMSSNDAVEDVRSGVTAFNSDGFSLGSAVGANENSDPLVAWAWDAGANSNRTYNVTVVSDSGNKYRFNGYGTSAVTLDLAEGNTYVFDSSDSSVDSHPFVLGTSANSNEYSTGVVYTLDGVVKTYSEYISGFASATTRKLTITVPASAPTLYYWCYYHSGMGGQVNTNSTNGSSNFDGTIQACIQSDASVGFSVIKFSGNGVTGATLGHELNKKPEFFTVKLRSDVGNWFTYHESYGASKYTTLDRNHAAVDNDYLNYTEPTSSVITFSNKYEVNGNNQDLICYAYTSVPGYSSFGSYTGNGSTDGPFVFTGFKPRFILQKTTATETYGNWHIYDTARDPLNPVDNELYPNLTNAEGSIPGGDLDILSNGFKIRTSYAGGWNTDGTTYIYAAFAEHPFKTARAR